MTNADALKARFWTALADSPFVFLQLDADPHTAVPMTAQLDIGARSAIWFFTGRDHHLAPGGPATATFASKGHDLFARFAGTLTEEASRTRLEEEWSPAVDAWMPGGKDNPNLLMLRMDLGRAEIWNADLGFIDTTKMLLGFDMRDEAADEHAETAL